MRMLRVAAGSVSRVHDDPRQINSLGADPPEQVHNRPGQTLTQVPKLKDSCGIEGNVTSVTC